MCFNFRAPIYTIYIFTKFNVDEKVYNMKIIYILILYNLSISDSYLTGTDLVYNEICYSKHNSKRHEYYWYKEK